MKTLIRVSVLACVVAGSLVGGAAHASAPRIHGIQRDDLTGACPLGNALASYTMEGSLIGCWWLDTIQDRSHPSGTYQATGTEHFSGCLDRDGDGRCGAGDPQGTLWFGFRFTAKYDASGAEIHGRCWHPVLGGSGGFTGATGVLQFKDILTDPPYYPYRGTLKV